MRSHNQSPVDDAEPLVRHVESGDQDRVVIDFGAGSDSLRADVVDGTVIVVGPDEEQLEFDVPTANASTFIRNGVLTIEVNE